VISVKEKSTMQPCPELKNLILQNYEKEASGKVLEVVTSSYSHQEGVTLIATDPNEWFEGFDSILHFYEQADEHKLDVKVDVLKAYCEGNVGWTIDRVTVKLPNGVELPIRHTHIFIKRMARGK
jgi:hypothetical protein